MIKTIIQKITPFLWFDHDAEEAALDTMKSERVMEAMLQIKKIDIQRLMMAYEGQ